MPLMKIHHKIFPKSTISLAVIIAFKKEPLKMYLSDFIAEIKRLKKKKIKCEHQKDGSPQLWQNIK